LRSTIARLTTVGILLLLAAALSVEAQPASSVRRIGFLSGSSPEAARGFVEESAAAFASEATSRDRISMSNTDGPTERQTGFRGSSRI
jgi:hypothetical protein